MIASAGRWAAATASVRGAAHVRSNKPNQDAVRVVEADLPIPGLVAAVCDGHGGDRYVRSDVGAMLAAEVACRVGSEALGHVGGEDDLRAVQEHLAAVVTPAVVERWRDRVRADVRRRAFTAEERSRSGVDPDEEVYLSYGCTLILAVMSPEWIGLVQIGDGDVVVIDGEVTETPVPGDDRLIGGETTSLCLPSAMSDARIRVLGAPLPELVILASDGYANSFAEPSWRTDVSVDLRRHVRRRGIEGIDVRLPDWLAESARVGGDDVSMALILRTDAQVSSPTGDDEDEHTDAGWCSSRRPRRRVLLVLLAAVLVAAALLAWVATERGGAVTPTAGEQRSLRDAGLEAPDPHGHGSTIGGTG